MSTWMRPARNSPSRSMGPSSRNEVHRKSRKSFTTMVVPVCGASENRASPTRPVCRCKNAAPASVAFRWVPRHAGQHGPSRRPRGPPLVTIAVHGPGRVAALERQLSGRVQHGRAGAEVSRASWLRTRRDPGCCPRFCGRLRAGRRPSRAAAFGTVHGGIAFNPHRPRELWRRFAPWAWRPPRLAGSRGEIPSAVARWNKRQRRAW